MKLRPYIIALLITALFALPSYPSISGLQLKSYLEYKQPYVSGNERLRFIFKEELSDDIDLNCEYELGYYYGGELADPVRRELLLKTYPYYLGLDYIVLGRDDPNSRYIMKQRMDRLNFKSGNWTVGRDAVNLGVGWIFSPNDIFAPFSPAQTDRDRKRGVDIARFDTDIYGITDITLIYAPLDAAKSDYVLRFTDKILEVETGLIIGQMQENTVYGLTLVSPQGLRASLNLSIKPQTFPPTTQGTYTYMLGGEALIFDDLYLFTEFFYNGLGKGRTSQYDWARYMSGNILALAQHYLSVGYSLDLGGPLVNEGSIISNLDDGSRLYREELNLFFCEDKSLRSGLILSSGAADSEYFSFSSLFYTLLSLYI